MAERHEAVTEASGPEPFGVDIEVAFDKLAGFARADDIACFLAGQGVKGQPRNSQHCPLAEWLRQATAEKSVMVSGSGVFLGTKLVRHGYGTFVTAVSATWAKGHTPAMADFVRRFDGGHYPDLVAEGYRPAPIDSAVWTAALEYAFTKLDATPVPVSGKLAADAGYDNELTALYVKMMTAKGPPSLAGLTDS